MTPLPQRSPEAARRGLLVAGIAIVAFVFGFGVVVGLLVALLLF